MAGSGRYGFPSGHAQLAVVTWGALAIFAGTRAAALGAAVIIIGICLSRLYLGVHDIEDVAGGLTLGVLGLLLFARYREALTERWTSLPGFLQGPCSSLLWLCSRWYGPSRTALGPFLG